MKDELKATKEEIQSELRDKIKIMKEEMRTNLDKFKNDMITIEAKLN